MATSWVDKFRYNGLKGGAERQDTEDADQDEITHLKSKAPELKKSASDDEKVLQNFQRRFSDIDKMEIQDCLVRHNWDKEAAMKELDSEYMKLVDKNKAKSTSVSPITVSHNTAKLAHKRPTKAKNSHKYAAINAAQRVETNTPSSPPKRFKRARFADSDDEDESATKRDKVYMSSDSESEDERLAQPSSELAKIRKQVLEFLNEATEMELEAVPNLSKKRVEKILSMRPFSSYEATVKAMKSTSGLTPDILNNVQSFLSSRNIIAKLMTSCDGIVKQMRHQVERLHDKSTMSIRQQPSILSSHLKLAPHQLIGVNWMSLLHEKKLNGILADEMGLGKTIQVVAFLAHLLEKNIQGPHLIVVPSSTLDNWHREFTTWCPTLKVVIYSGPQEDRKILRLDTVNNRISFNVIITTYNTLSSTPEDRGFFKKMQFTYAVFDEAHMLKNMMTQRYQSLMQINSNYKMMLTGTPLQNNLIELMSLLTFTMPNLFANKRDHMTSLFKGAKAGGDGDSARNKFERERINQAKSIMQPFVLRRLKSDVLNNLPTKHDVTEHVPLTEPQQKLYKKLVTSFKKTKVERREDDVNSEGSVLMQLRKAANHPLLMRTFYDDKKLARMAKIICKQRSHRDSSVECVIEDMEVMSDFELNALCGEFGECLDEFLLPDTLILDSGKFKHLQSLIKEHLEKKNRILIFSQFTMVLDIVEKFLHILKYNYLRIDGSTPVSDRQDMIDMFSNDETIPIFLLSTKACGLGINLTAANVVILHDIDFNPYNDKQAEDRCHRIGQTREVHIHRLVAKGTIEEAMHSIAQEKLKLEKRVTAEEDQNEEKVTMMKLLKQALAENLD
ncbi:SWI/SNF-related matrix-associated actin-dependent regulator of chromatin subfamily A containing DEAD/H box 1 [Galendromus occidentalis]|uniref:SWI/SNF-related matrix-associated actin-dependent regulator of chromatin subfamily A containing DEAD/H box 1 homolog n=1 Tax=Galendromus occidentalis TaxID=34638 RepID=A0AAJ7SG69_9ACAR|nr:SWI/SNF-related matrix-associated actin-dependent regulator of chromatin subfamily A containing DEAD/H box 1 [Galendromus occidentalis]